MGRAFEADVGQRNAIPAAPASVKEVCERIWRLEEAHGLLDWTLSGVKVWQLVRMPLYYMIMTKTGIFTTPHANKLGLWDTLRASGALLNVVIKNPLWGSYTKETLVFEHARKVLVDGEYTDIYTQALRAKLSEDEVDVIEPIHDGRHVTKAAPNRSYLDVLTIGSFLYSSVTRVGFSREEREAIRRIEQDLNAAFNTFIRLGPLFARYIKHFRFSYAFYRTLIEKRRPRRIYLIVSYSFYMGPLIAAAKDLGVETVEIQHGTLSPYHLGYHFPGHRPSSDGAAPVRELDYFPSMFLAFGDYWRSAADFPLPPERIRVYGFPHFIAQQKRVDLSRRRSRQILFISQGVIGRRLSDLVLECARQLPDFPIVFKLHPGEYARWRQDYPSLVEAAALANVKVVDDSKRSLHAYFAESEFVVGVFSTAIFEGLALGCKTIVVDLPGVEYMRKLIDEGIALKVASAGELVGALREGFCPTPFESGYFFHDDTETRQDPAHDEA